MLLARPGALPLVAVWSAALVAGCASLLSIDDFRDQATAGSGGGGRTGAAGSGTGGRGAGSESCLDKVDNNGDGLADCEDPQCAVDHQCSPAWIGDWLGVGWLHQSNPAPDCPLGQRLALYDAQNLVEPSATCSCGCAAPTDTDCRTWFTCPYACTVGGAYYTAWPTTECSAIEFSTSVSVYCYAGDLSAAPGHCEPEGILTGAPLTWDPTAALCLYADGGHCPGEQTCVPGATGPALGPCVAQLGDHDCPPDYPDQHRYWDGSIDDGRACTTGGCSCGQATGAACSCTTEPCGVEAFSGSDCTGTPRGVSLMSAEPPDCIHYSGMSGTPPFYYGIRVVGATVTDPGSCASSGSSHLQGSIAPAEPVTVCCVAD